MKIFERYNFGLLCIKMLKIADFKKRFIIVDFLGNYLICTCYKCSGQILVYFLALRFGITIFGIFIEFCDAGSFQPLYCRTIHSPRVGVAVTACTFSYKNGDKFLASQLVLRYHSSRDRESLTPDLGVWFMRQGEYQKCWAADYIR